VVFVQLSGQPPNLFFQPLVILLQLPDLLFLCLDLILLLLDDFHGLLKGDDSR